MHRDYDLSEPCITIKKYLNIPFLLNNLGQKRVIIRKTINSYNMTAAVYITSGLTK